MHILGSHSESSDRPVQIQPQSSTSGLSIENSRVQAILMALKHIEHRRGDVRIIRLNVFVFIQDLYSSQQ
jgi:hypothetical protein